LWTIRVAFLELTPEPRQEHASYIENWLKVLRADKRAIFRAGDMVEESNGDLMGDGVNIAARSEGIAQPGAICLSEDAYRQVKSRLDLPVNDLGATQLKNIAEPVRKRTGIRRVAH
jgi:class 3 adenylate cyclase